MHTVILQTDGQKNISCALFPKLIHKRVAESKYELGIAIEIVQGIIKQTAVHFGYDRNCIDIGSTIGA